MVLLGETRLMATGKSIMGRLDRESVLQPFSGAPLGSQSGCIWDYPLGGAAVLVRHGSRRR